MEGSCLKTAIRYAQRGWSVIPIPYRSKNPGRSGWDQLRLTEVELNRHFGRGRRNVGVLLGAPSGWLVDVDLDHKLAVSLAGEYLPSTGAIFGRAGKCRSHYLYIVSQPANTRQWRLPDRKMVAELRSTGSQTIFPGSTHPNGEFIEWDADDGPATIAPEVLTRCLNSIHDEVCRQLSVSKLPAPDKRASAVAAPHSVLNRARCYLAKLPPAISQQGGHASTFRAACRLVLGFGLDRNQTLVLLREWNATCQPPWSEKELVHKVDDALKQPGWRGYLLAGRPMQLPASSAIERANHHAIAHRRRAVRRAPA